MIVSIGLNSYKSAGLGINEHTARLERLLAVVDDEYLKAKASFDRLQAARVAATKAQEGRNDQHGGIIREGR